MSQPMGIAGFEPEQFQKRYDELQQQMTELQQGIEQLSETATSDDRLITATVGARGELRELRLDPRIYRNTNADKLSQNITETIWAATRAVTIKLASLAGTALPGNEEELMSALKNVPDAEGGH